MNFYQNISPIVDFLHSIRKLENYISFDMIFSSKWVFPKNMLEQSQVVPFESPQENCKGISFVCESNETEVENTLKKINKIIKLNKEREIKDKLFKETVDKLKSTFEKTELDKLKKLYFDFEEDLEKIELEDESGENFELVGEGETKG